MRKIIVMEWLSLDGFMAGPNGETDWFVWDDEIEKYAVEFQGVIDTMLFGRTTYELMAGYWPTPASGMENPSIIDFMNNTHKIVFSKTLKNLEWKNSRLMKEIVPEEIETLKQGPGKHIVIYGSGSIVSRLMKLNLIDEYQIFLNPIVFGNGKPLFQNFDKKVQLRHLKTKTFTSGNVLLNYAGKSKER